MDASAFGSACDRTWERDSKATCSRKTLGTALQPCWVVGEDVRVCGACAAVCVPAGLSELVTTPAPLSFRCQVEELASSGVAADLFGEAEESVPSVLLREGALRAAIALQRPDESESVRKILASGFATRQRHESADALAAARATIPIAEVLGAAYARRARQDALALGQTHDSAAAAHAAALAMAHDIDLGEATSIHGYPTDAVAEELLRWFKGPRFFRWYSKPSACVSCGTDRKDNLEYARTEGPLTEEEMKGMAQRVEVYRCRLCGSEATRFPRYNDPVKLLESRQGRCGEFANLFTLCCLALGLRARYVLDVTDHVWTEIWSVEARRWLHADSCEKKLDKPRLYECGWGKKLVAVFAFDACEVIDVTKRYARANYAAVLERRAARFGCSEATLQAEVDKADSAAQTTAMRDDWTDTLPERRDAELTELSEAVFGDSSNDNEVLGARTTGDADWIASRGEAGALPGGSWRNSARNAKLVSSSITPPCRTLEAELRTCDGDWSTATVALVLDDDEFDNIDGTFVRPQRIHDRALSALAASLRDEARDLPALEAAQIRRRHDKILANIRDNPTNEKFRSFNLENPIVKNSILKLPSAEAWLNLSLGFNKHHNKLVAPHLPTAAVDQIVTRAKSALAALRQAWPP